jgi:hypothetical protein
MSEVERYDEARDPAHELVGWARAAEAAAEIARPLSQTAFVPEAYQGKPGDAAAAILVGAEVGLSPMQALQGIYVIKGKPAMYARTLMAIVLAAGHEVWTEKATANTAVVKGRRRGSERVETSEWTIARAREAGYTNNAKYKTDPESMLLARAQAELCRRLAPDAILGMGGYSVEEMQDEDAPAAPRRTVKRQPIQEPSLALDAAPDPVPRATDDVHLPPLPGEEPPPEETEPETKSWARQAMPGAITQPQMRMMMALLKKAELHDREDRLDYCSAVVGRQLETSTDLTKGEAQIILDRLLELTKETE